MATYSVEPTALALTTGLQDATLRISGGIIASGVVLLPLTLHGAALSGFKSIEPSALALTPALQAADLRLTRVAQASALALTPALQTATLRISNGIARPSALALALSLKPATFTLAPLVAYPASGPSAIRFTPPAFPLTKSRTQQGATVTRIWSSGAGDAKLDLEYDVVLDSEAESILDAWDNARGTLLPVALPDSTFGGASGDLLTQYKLSGRRLRWKFAGKPQVTSLYGNHSSVTVSFRGVSDKRMTVNV